MDNGQPQQEPSIESILISIRTIFFEDMEEFQHLSSFQVDTSEQVFDHFDMPDLSLQQDIARLASKEMEDTQNITLDIDQAFDDRGYNILTLMNTLVTQETKCTDLSTSVPTSPESTQYQMLRDKDDTVDCMSSSSSAVSAAALSSLTRVACGQHSYLNHTLTLEVLVRKALRPLLKRWINDHLPLIVEQIVSIEIKRLVDQMNSQQDGK